MFGIGLELEMFDVVWVWLRVWRTLGDVLVWF